MAGIAAVWLGVFLLPLFVTMARSPSVPLGQLGARQAAPAPRPDARWTARVTLSGPVSGSWNGPLDVASTAPDRRCRVAAQRFTGLDFRRTAATGDLDIAFYLPRGAAAPGTYDLTDSSHGAGVLVAYTRATNQFQYWGPGGRGPEEPRPPGRITATLDVSADGSGTLTATNLLSVYVTSGDPSFDLPLDVAMSFTCA